MANGKVVPGMCLCVFSVVAIVGAVLMVVSKNTAEDTEEMNPEQDFIQFSSACKVTSVDYSTRDTTLKRSIEGAPGSHKRMTVCEDIITYGFTAPNSSQSYKATVETRLRCDVGECKCDESARTWNGAFTLQASYYCWKPSGDRSAVPSSYGCPNDPCYKLNDPAEDKDSLQAQGMTLASVAGALLGVGLSCMCVCSVALACSICGAKGSPEGQ